MYEGQRVLAIIPARAGSKGLLNKNKLPLCGKLLIQYTIEAALASAYIDDIVVTTDDLDIIELCHKLPVITVIRPQDLANDYSCTTDVVKHVLNSFSSYQYFSLLQPTSPLRLPSDIDQTIIHMHTKGSSSCVTISSSKQAPSSLFTIDQGVLKRFCPKPDKQSCRRQDQPPFFFVNGSIYTVRISCFERKPGFIFDDSCAVIIPQERSVDIDTQYDYDVVVSIIEKAKEFPV